MFAFQANAQFGYEKHSEKDGITVYYKWKHSKFCNKNSPLILDVKMKNTNEYNVDAKISILYYIDGVCVQENYVNHIDLKPVKLFIFNMIGIGLVSELTNEQLQSDNFSWKLKIEEVKKANIDIEKKGK
jgi:hypothetical protein